MLKTDTWTENVPSTGEKAFILHLETGTAWLAVYRVHADNLQDAADTLADYLEARGCTGLYTDDAEHAEANSWICAGNHCHYISLHNAMEETQA